MAVVFVEERTAESCIACAPNTFTASEVVHRVNETHPCVPGTEWKISHSNMMPDGRKNPCLCPNIMGRRHWRLTR